MWNRNKVTPEMMKGIRPTSKLSLKLTCLAVNKGDVDKAMKMYEYFAKDMDLPDVDPVAPTTFQQVKETAGGIFGWVKENQEDLAKAFNMVQSFRSGKTISVAPSAPVEVPPPLPPVE
jgi:hypothetical protein|uniref:Uncharacterized protein n=1 Tax=Myoviridae sp. ctByu2 TaxID=2827668 RepID=A0A8S5S9U1_9CAUD|nr:MAG TPA: hypothetical protein [Myoviridae sp. ctByu2]